MTLIMFAVMLLLADEGLEFVELDPIDDNKVPVASIEITDATGNPVTGQVPIGQMIIVNSSKAVHAHKPGSLTWRIRPSLQSYTSLDGETLILNTGLKPQVVEILQIVSLADRNTYQELSIKIGNAPNPPPDPDVDPEPEPEPEPIYGKLQVVIIEEVSDRPTLPPSQQAILVSKKLKDYRDTHCVITNGAYDYKILDKDLDVSQQPEWLKVAFNESRSTLPWIVLSNGRQGYSGPLPQTEEETLTLLQKYGGP